MMIKLESFMSCDVFVAGAGIAGIMAAIEAAKQQQNVILASSAHLFSGSSFYPGTWGFGLIGPENEQDEEDLVQTILSVGCGMAEEAMVRSFVKELLPTIADLQEMGIELLDAKEKDQKEFIPCFDHKKRSWHGVVKEKAKARLETILEELEIRLLPNCDLVEIVEENQQTAGVIVCNEKTSLQFIQAKAVVLATGGYGGLFEHRLTSSDITGMGHYLALKHGCSLINMEFMQMMPALVPTKEQQGEAPIIFNEKTFRFASLPSMECESQLLEQRGGYGPFTSRLPAREIDFAIASAGRKGIEVIYQKEMQQEMPEFIRTYFDWLRETKNLTPDSDIRIAMFAHAANGGIRIGTDASTELPGLYACGEVTGGMHGADRIGGLSTANGFVFGRKAGQSAARYAKSHKGTEGKGQVLELWEIPNREAISKWLQHQMMESAMVIRTEAGLTSTLNYIEDWQQGMQRIPTSNVEAYVESKRLEAQLQIAKAILQAELLRKESRGSHYRGDYPNRDENLTKRIVIRLEGTNITSKFEEK